MILGIGTDIVEIERVVKACANPRFLQKYFSENEKKLFEKSIRRVASNFSVKESFVKALGSGFRSIDPRDIEVCRDELGKPYINVIGKLKDSVPEDIDIFVSISNSKKYVVSTVVIERCK